MIPMVIPDDDFVAVDEIEQKLGATEVTRNEERERIGDRLRSTEHNVLEKRFILILTNLYLALSRTLEAARISSSRPATVPSADGHVKLLTILTTQR
jgi:kinetochore protein Spc24